ncbi:cupin domain-containing protein [Anaerocolumna sp. AGMB13025]|uniref:cupin domain-containing protein n=1 Tax=Anaerocolumna sp. AGMB13025 TaxID=3039116 RepID=UPI00241DFB81|nr:cupin domain-containing protein [Anaerocolumna sp. AGMB13025]WFR56011.1 cupin domain-containing protein [Anaerocolumna sp. AGMB13025]
MKDDILIRNESSLIGKHKSEHEPYEYTKYEVTTQGEFSQCYVAVYEIPPMKSNYPYHYHTNNTEVFYIISGQGILRTPNGERVIKPGDIIVCPPSEYGAHKIMNNSQTEPLKYIDFDTTNSPDIIRYPDSDKTGIFIRNQSNTVFRNDDKTSYYDGE